MDYTDAVAAFFVPRQEGTALPVAVTDGSPVRRLRDACEPVAMHAVWSRTTNERLAQLGLDFLTSYVGGRGACLGEAPRSSSASDQGIAYRVRASVSLTCNVGLDGHRDE